MMLNNIIDYFKDKGLPVKWQLYILAPLSISFLISFIRNDHLLSVVTLSNHFIIFIGIVAGYLYHKQKNYPRFLIVSGAAFILVAKILESFISFGFPIHSSIAFFIEEQGIVLITLFAFYHMQMFEGKFNIKGFTIDYTLLLISFLFFFLLILPNVFNTLFYEFDHIQQLLFINIFIGVTLLTMSIVHYFLSKSMGLTDVIRLTLTILFTAHFGLELFLSFDITTDKPLTKGLSLTSYHLAGALAIAFIFLEKLSLEYSSLAPSRLGNLFMWIASITAIVTIPLGLIIRSIIDSSPINLLIIGLAGSIISIIVIWRFILLINGTNQQRKRLRTLIQTNTVTGLPNYQGYLEKITLSQMTNLLVVSINIDDFKSINDLYGRESADEVLNSLASRIKEIPNTVLAAHTHSDLFLVVYQTQKDNIDALIKNLQKSLGVWDKVLGKTITVPLTYGASYCKGLTNPEILANQAEQAQKTARAQHTTYALYIDEKDDDKLPRHEVRDILQQSVDQNYLPVHFQPIYDLEDGSLKALELLIRVESEEHGLLLPGQFLEQAKSYGLLTSLTQVCVRMIAKHYATLPDVVININLPPYMLKSQELLNNFIHLFEEENLPPNKFCIEITEDEDIPTSELIFAVRHLKDRGFTIAMDDFGTGYSSLDRLSMLAVDTVKIDRSLLLTASAGNTAILEWAILLAKRLGICAVVEGVETKEQLSLVKLLGADSVQGFLYSKPVPALQTGDIALNSNDISIA